MQLYNITANAIAKVDPVIAVGGPASAALSWVPQFLESTGNGTVLPARFVSTHSYPTDYGGGLTRTQFEDGIIAVAEVAEAAGLPLVITEFAAGLGNQFDCEWRERANARARAHACACARPPAAAAPDAPPATPSTPAHRAQAPTLPPFLSTLRPRSWAWPTSPR